MSSRIVQLDIAVGTKRYELLRDPTKGELLMEVGELGRVHEQLPLRWVPE